MSLLESKMGIAIAPLSTSVSGALRRVPINSLDLKRTVYLYAVAGRPRSAAAATLMQQLQAADWSKSLG